MMDYKNIRDGVTATAQDRSTNFYLAGGIAIFVSAVPHSDSLPSEAFLER